MPQKISQLVSQTAPGLTAVIPLVESGLNYKVTVQDLARAVIVTHPTLTSAVTTALDVAEDILDTAGATT